MNVLFLSLGQYWSIEEHDIYTDLLREFIKDGHRIYMVSPIERHEGKFAHSIIKEESSEILKVQTGNIQKTNAIEKGINTLLIEHQFLRAIKKCYKDKKFDLVMYPTPPITFANVIRYVKKHHGAKSYLLLKDIFPQNAVDIGILSTTGVKGFLYKYFRRQEKKLYALSDRIGCMSQANVEYVIKHNPEIDSRIVEVCPNSIEVIDKSVDEEARASIRTKYGISFDKKVFVYGGNLGKPQGIPFLIECIEKCKDIEDLYFLIVGDGTEYCVLEEYVNTKKTQNVKLMRYLPREDYDILVGACDVGLIFLDHRFTIPNFPSRLLSYMQAKIPVLVVTDSNTDIGNVVTGIDKNGNKTHEPFGWWCESNDADGFRNKVEIVLNEDLSVLGLTGYDYIKRHYSVEKSYKKIWVDDSREW